MPFLELKQNPVLKSIIMKIRNALYIAGTILLGATLISQFEQSELITQIILVLLSAFLLIWGYREDKKRGVCLNVKNKRLKIFGVTLGVSLVFMGLGFTVGRILYHVIH